MKVRLVDGLLSLNLSAYAVDSNFVSYICFVERYETRKQAQPLSALSRGLRSHPKTSGTKKRGNTQQYVRTSLQHRSRDALARSGQIHTTLRCYVVRGWALNRTGGVQNCVTLSVVAMFALHVMFWFNIALDWDFPNHMPRRWGL